mmetsp:Transcript_12896/g.19329  ORF Transcript_12896/g.19329 Transcript_12896/m.19329 type:complete len:385 (+) Transcript_12896:58-1212(+)
MFSRLFRSRSDPVSASSAIGKVKATYALFRTAKAESERKSLSRSVASKHENEDGKRSSKKVRRIASDLGAAIEVLCGTLESKDEQKFYSGIEEGLVSDKKLLCSLLVNDAGAIPCNSRQRLMQMCAVLLGRYKLRQYFKSHPEIAEHYVMQLTPTKNVNERAHAQRFVIAMVSCEELHGQFLTQGNDAKLFWSIFLGFDSPHFDVITSACEIISMLIGSANPNIKEKVINKIHEMLKTTGYNAYVKQRMGLGILLKILTQRTNQKIMMGYLGKLDNLKGMTEFLLECKHRGMIKDGLNVLKLFIVNPHKKEDTKKYLEERKASLTKLIDDLPVEEPESGRSTNVSWIVNYFNKTNETNNFTRIAAGGITGDKVTRSPRAGGKEF